MKNIGFTKTVAKRIAFSLSRGNWDAYIQRESSLTANSSSYQWIVVVQKAPTKGKGK